MFWLISLAALAVLVLGFSVSNAHVTCRYCERKTFTFGSASYWTLSSASPSGRRLLGGALSYRQLCRVSPSLRSNAVFTCPDCNQHSKVDPPSTRSRKPPPCPACGNAPSPTAPAFSYRGAVPRSVAKAFGVKLTQEAFEGYACSSCGEVMDASLEQRGYFSTGETLSRPCYFFADGAVFYGVPLWVVGMVVALVVRGCRG